MDCTETSQGGKGTEDAMECCKCGWVGTLSEQSRIPSKEMAAIGVKGEDYVCPRCGHDSFYRVEKAAAIGCQ